jgi:molecular chaperone IbpA
MTRNTTYLTTVDVPSYLSQLHRATVGFDRLFDQLNKTVSSNANTYPPHDIVKHSDTSYTIEVAVAGFKESELEVTVEENILTIKGSKTTQPEREYVYKGISSKAFTKVIPLAEHVVVKSASYQDGLLIVAVDIEIPDMLKPRKILITSTPTKQIAE